MSRWPLLAVALTVALTAPGCGSSSGVDLHANEGAKPFVKWGKPSVGRPEGVVILLHGGGWQPNPSAYPGELSLAATMQKQGYATVVIGYDAGAQGFQEIEGVYRQAQRRYRGVPICAHGISAGGHLGLMLAAREPDLACVVDIVGPTDLTTLKDQGADEAYNLAVNAFGQDQLARWSPVRYANRIKAKVLILLAATDPVIPAEQGREFARAHPGTQLIVLPAGSTPFPVLHGAKVTPAGAQEALQEPFAFISQATGGA
jgi:dienelactone hydrolase